MLLCNQWNKNRWFYSQRLKTETKDREGFPVFCYEFRGENMEMGKIFVYYGAGRGKTSLAIGQGIRTVGEGKKAVMIQFLDYNNTKEVIPLKKLEPDFRVFRFEKQRQEVNLSDEITRKEIGDEIRLEFQFANKIIETGECDLLILDGILEAVGQGFIEEDALLACLAKKEENMDLILTGGPVFEKLTAVADSVYHISIEKKAED